MSTDNKETKSTNKSNKILIGIIIALAVVIIGLVVVIFAGGNKDKKKEGNTTIETNDATGLDAEKEDSTASDAKKEDEDDTEAEGEAEPDCYVTVALGDNWGSEGSISGKLEFKIVNNSDKEIKNWSIQVPVADSTKIESSWNGNFSISGGVMTITPVDHNLSVAAGSEMSNVGLIVNVTSQSELQSISDNAKLYVDGVEYVSVSNTANNDEKDEATSEESTTEAKDEEEQENTTAPAEPPAKPETGTPFDNHGKLSVKGTDLVDKNGNKYQLKGVSTHGIAWFPDYVNKDAIQTFRDDWDANLFRIAMYTDEYGGYCNGGDKEYLKGLVDKGVNAATELGMYVIIDWHILHDLTPQKYKEDAKVFFEDMSSKYKDYDNVIYEICNEPNGGTQWSDVKSYAEEIIPIIRANDPDAIIIVGTPNWSQDVDIAAKDPITGYDNIMYAIHFYASTHTDNIRNKATTALESGLPIFISEFSICDASGNGAIDYNQADIWFDLIEKYNLSYAAWNVSNKDETSSLIKSSCTKLSGWTESELSETGVYIRNKIKGID
ncbi:MAG: cellulase family glycosylhydrolase [Lachnospiraceae bacterium]|nr:cellulase family glycosylhydrolase [Lachnospiraceae bacterium]